MTDKYVDNTKNAGIPVGIQTTTEGCSCAVGTKIVAAAAGTPFSTCTAGDPFYVTSTGTYHSPGVYIIASVNGGGASVTLNHDPVTASELDVDTAHTPCDGTVPASEKSGANGPYPTIQYAVHHAAVGSDVYIKANSGYKFDDLDQPKTNSAGNPEGIVFSISGNVGNNTHIRFIGYKTTPGDMDKGGAYYGGALDYYKQINSLDAYMVNPSAEWVEIDANDISDDLLNITALAIHNVHFRNIKFFNLSSFSVLKITQTNYGWSFRNCVFDDTYTGGVVSGALRAALFEDCSFGPTIGVGDVDWGVLNLTSAYGVSVVGCVFDLYGTNMAMALYRCNQAVGNLIISAGGTSVAGIAIKDYGNVVCNNTIYNPIDCIDTDDSAATLIEYNNILMPSNHSTGYGVHRQAGTIVYSDYSCCFSTDGNAMDSGYAWPTGFKGVHSIEVTPQLVGPANGDFRPLNPAALRGGIPDLRGDAGQTGAILQKYQFSQRARMSNRARLHIVR